MNFDYSDDQKFVKEEARKFLAMHCPTSVPRAILEDDGKSYDRKLWQAVVRMGWTGAAIPERWGGSALGYIEICAIAEELGRVIAPLPFASTVYILAEALLKFGTEAQREAMLPGVANGTVIGCLAMSERQGAARFAAMDSKVVANRLSGTKAPVTDGDCASHAIVAANDVDGPGLFIVDLEGPGIAREKVRTLDPTRGAARIGFVDAPCERLGVAGSGAAVLSAVLDRAAIFFAFEQLGGADRCLDDARNYALDRHAFGRPIASYQAIKHKLADMYVKNEIARSNAYYAAWALNTGAGELPRAAAAARISATQAYIFAAAENLQTHGGSGFTWDMDCHLHLRRARQLALALGGLPLWREKLVRALEHREAA